MTKVNIETNLDGGKSMYQFAIDKGIKEADVTALLTNVHKTAFTKAASDGVMTQSQADAILQNMIDNSFNFVNFQMQNDGEDRVMQGGNGQGGMMGSWDQQQFTTNL